MIGTDIGIIFSVNPKIFKNKKNTSEFFYTHLRDIWSITNTWLLWEKKNFNAVFLKLILSELLFQKYTHFK